MRLLHTDRAVARSLGNDMTVLEKRVAGDSTNWQTRRTARLSHATVREA